MRVALGHEIKDGPWGGGNQFARALADRLVQRGHGVVFDLTDDDIDVIVMVDPRRSHPTVTIRPPDILRYWRRWPTCAVVHRINECDERKGTRSMNFRLRLANYVADHTVFIASWLKDLRVWRPADGKGCSVILNGADPAVFHADGQRPWSGAEPLRLVTHHWGGNSMKGFDVYDLLDRMMGEPEWRRRLDFTYVGNLPSGYAFRHARHVAPLAGPALGDALRQAHSYVTASVNEPAGMHHIEGALCGLPLLYRRSGALPEYCQGFGEGFDGVEDFPAALQRMMAAYAGHRAAMPGYDRTAQRMADGYIDLFEQLARDGAAIAARRRPWRNPLLRLLNLIRW